MEIMKKILLSFFVVLALISKAQVGIGGGFSMLKPFGAQLPSMGVMLMGEYPKDDLSSFYARALFYEKTLDEFKQYTTANALLPTTQPSFTTVSYSNSMNYTVIEGGNRYYVGEGYDSGFGIYGGGNMSMIFNKVVRNFDDYDQTNYQLSQQDYITRGSIFNVAFGLNGGLKYTFSGVGTLMLDGSVSYLIFSTASNTVAQGVASTLYSPLLFSFNLGFRKDIY